MGSPSRRNVFYAIAEGRDLKVGLIILKYYCSRQIDGWAGPIDEWAVLTYGSEHPAASYLQQR